MHGSSAGRIARSRALREQLTKEWLAAIVDRTPLPEVGELPLRWLTAEGPELIAGICATVETPGPIRGLDPATRARALRLAQLRPGPGAAEQTARDLAALHRLLIERLGAGPAEEAPAENGRLAEVFGAIHGAIALARVTTQAPVAKDPVTGLPGSSQLDSCVRMLLAEHRRYGHGFSLALVDVDGLRHINEAYGRHAGDRMLVAVAAILRRELRDVDQVFRLDEDEFAIVAPHTEAASLVSMATRVAGVISRSQTADGPRIAIEAGVVECPADGLSAERLLESATEASFAAKAAGAPVALSPAGPQAVMQDP